MKLSSRTLEDVIMKWWLRPLIIWKHLWAREKGEIIGERLASSWSLPPPVVFKVNCDAASRQGGLASLGTLLRAENGALTAAVKQEQRA